jgi:phage shock protein PspC (stress-responsive transcriptional regulator)
MDIDSDETPISLPDPSDAPPGPDRSSPKLDPRRLERSSTDRLIAGVAGGVAEYFRVDPSFVRIAFVVLSLFGGVGLVLYAAAWLLMPENGSPSASAAFLAEPRRHGTLFLVGVVAAGIVVVSLLSNGPFWGMDGWRTRPRLGWLVILGVLAFLVLRLMRPSINGIRRFSILRLFRTLLILGGALVSLALVSTLVAVLVTGVSLRGGIGSKDWRPTSAAQLATNYRAGIGNMTLDLRQVVFPSRAVHVSASVAIGRLVVEVPPGVRVSVSARSGIGNVVYGPGGDASFAGGSPSSRQVLVLNAQVGIGEVQLVRSSASAYASASSRVVLSAP